MSSSSNNAKASYKSAYKGRNNIITVKSGKGLVNQRDSFDELEAAKAEAVIGSTLAALDRYLATVIGSLAARAAMDHLKLVNARAA